MLRILSLFYLVLCHGLAYSQETSCTITIAGAIIDEHDKEPLGFSTVYILELERGAAADEFGKYVINDLCPGTYTFRVSHIGCETADIKLTIKSNTTRNFFLEHHAKELKHFEVTAERTKEQKTEAVSTLKARELEATRGSGLAESLRSLPGLNMIQTGATIGKPVIHGMSGNRVLILNNGIRQEGQQWGTEHAPELDPFIANEIEVVKGASSVRYGADAIGGVILANPAHLPDSAGIGGKANLAGFSNGRQGAGSAMLEGRFQKLPLSWRIQGSGKKGGNIKAPDYFLGNTGVEELNFSWMAGLEKERWSANVYYSQFNSNIGIFEGSHIGNLTDLLNAFNAPAPFEKASFTYSIEAPYQRVEHELSKAYVTYNFGNWGKLTGTAARQYNLRMEFDSHGPGGKTEDPEVKFELTTFSYDLNFDHKKGKLKGSSGISLLDQTNTYEGRFFIPNYEASTLGAYVIERLKLERLEIEAGARYDIRQLDVYKRISNTEVYTPHLSFNNFSGTAGVIFDAFESTQVRLYSGSGWRAPSINELFSNGLHHGAAAIERGDEKLKIESAWNTSLTVTQSYGTVNGEVTGYYTVFSDYIYMEPLLPPVVTVRGAFPAFEYTQTDATISGADVLLKYEPFNWLEFSFKGSMVRGNNLRTSEPLIYMPADRGDLSITVMKDTMGALVHSHITLSSLVVSKQWRVPSASDYVQAPAGYELIGISAGTDLRLKNQNISIHFGINNLLNKKYRDYLDRFRYYTDAQGRNFTLRITIPFNILNRAK